MPEGLEAEIWRRALQPTVGRRITRVWVDDRVADEGIAATVTGATIDAVERAGKAVLVVTAAATIGLHLGMTGRIDVDEQAQASTRGARPGRRSPGAPPSGARPTSADPSSRFRGANGGSGCVELA